MAEKDYLQWLRSQPCAVQPCVAPAQAHHSTNAEAPKHEKSLGGRRGKGQRADDTAAFSLCLRHHGQFHDARGFCEGWDRAQRRRWQDEQVTLYRGRYEAELDAGAVPAPRVAAPPQPTLRQEAEAFGEYHSLGSQVVHDLERLLKKVVKEATF